MPLPPPQSCQKAESTYRHRQRLHRRAKDAAPELAAREWDLVGVIEEH